MRGLLLVAFGTAVPEAKRAYDLIEAQVRGAFPEMEVRWAYTSRTIRVKLAGQGKLLDSPELALARMMEEGFTHVAILSLHVIPGIEFHDLSHNARLYAQMTGGFESVQVARPLLSSREDMVRVANALLARAPQNRKIEEALLFLGHGSAKHPSDAVYAAMSHTFQQLASNVFVGAIQGYPSVDEILQQLSAKEIKKVTLMPLMAVAGDHVRNDMAGDKPNSWKSAIINRGIACDVIQTGIAEYKEVVDVWLDHLRDVLSSKRSG